MPKRVNITAQIMDDLLEAALSGDSGAEAEYRRYAEKLAHRSNQQLRSAEKENARGSAYKRAEHFLSQYGSDKVRFRERNKTLDLYALSDQVDQMLIYSSARDYSISVSRDIATSAAKISGALQAAGVDASDSWVAYQMADLFKTDAWKEFKKAHGRGTDLIQSAQDAFKRGKTVDDLIDAYADYKSNRDDSPDMVQAWERFAAWV